MFEITYAAPDHVSEGLVRYADGTGWNPGSGKGWYQYRSAVWTFIGGDTAADILTKIKTVDGAGSGLDADLLDGSSSAAFAAASHAHSGADITSGTVVDARVDAALARLASPVFTGDPTAPTPTLGDDDTSIATTAFVHNTIEDRCPVLIESQVVSTAVASLDFTTGIDSTFDLYVLELLGLVPATDGDALWLRMREAGAFKSGAANYKWADFGVNDAAASAATGSTGDTKIVLTPNVGNATGEHAGGTVKLARPSLSALHKDAMADILNINSSGALARRMTGGAYIGNTNPVTGLQVLFSTGNISAGRANLYGYPH